MRRLGQLPTRLKLGIFLILIFVVLGLVLPRFAPGDPLAWNSFPKNLVPSKAHILGTTSLGQDTFWFLTLAIQNSLLVGVVVAFFSTAIGVLAGLSAGYLGGWIDRGERPETGRILARWRGPGGPCPAV